MVVTPIGMIMHARFYDTIYVRSTDVQICHSMLNIHYVVYGIACLVYCLWGMSHFKDYNIRIIE